MNTTIKLNTETIENVMTYSEWEKIHNRYDVTCNEEERVFNSFNFMLWKLKEDM